MMEKGLHIGARNKATSADQLVCFIIGVTVEDARLVHTFCVYKASILDLILNGRLLLRSVS
jgi:hypothetical protein